MRQLFFYLFFFFSFFSFTRPLLTASKWFLFNGLPFSSFFFFLVLSLLVFSYLSALCCCSCCRCLCHSFSSPFSVLLRKKRKNQEKCLDGLDFPSANHRRQKTEKEEILLILLFIQKHSVPYHIIWYAILSLSLSFHPIGIASNDRNAIERE